MISDQTIETKNRIVTQQQSSIVKSAWEMKALKLRVLRQLFRVISQKIKNPLKVLQFISDLKKKYQKIFGEQLLTKAAKVDGRYFWRLAAPGFPSKASVKMHENEVNRLLPNQKKTGLRSLLFAITKKCPLNCEHCFEWDNLNKKEDLSIAEIIQIVHKYQDFGCTQMMFSGGEPMLRVNDLYTILEAAKIGTDFWIITSGLGLNAERAKKLKAAGLTGVMISLDHFDAEKHDQFRGYEGSYNWALQAVVYANQAGLVTTLSLCATRAFTNKENLKRYMDLAKHLSVSFVQIVEPRATGRYAGKEVDLGPKEITLLEGTYLEYNNSPAFKDYPIINYLGYHQRKVGCFGAGDRFFYIDTDGEAHVCPFCSKKMGKALAFSAEDMVDILGGVGCGSFESKVGEKGTCTKGIGELC